MIDDSILDYVFGDDDDDDDEESCDEVLEVIIYLLLSEGSVVMRNRGCDFQIFSYLFFRLFFKLYFLQDYFDVCKIVMKFVIENRLFVYSYGGFGDNLFKFLDSRFFQQMVFLLFKGKF